MPATPSRARIARSELLKLIPDQALRSFASQLDELEFWALAFALWSSIVGGEFIRERNRIPLKSGDYLVHYQVVAAELRCDIALLERSGTSDDTKNCIEIIDFTLPVKLHDHIKVAHSGRDDMPLYTAMRHEVRAQLEFIHNRA